MKRIINEAEAVRTVMKLLSIEGTSGHERAVAKLVAEEIKRSGLPRARIRHDGAVTKLPFEAEVGNLLVDIPGRGELAAEKPRLFSTHMDTVSIAAGAKPVRKGSTIRPRGKTALGADCRAGVGVLVTLVKTLARLGRLGRADHAPLLLLFTIAEETGLWGSRNVDRKALKRCRVGFNVDGGDPREVVVGAPSSAKFRVRIEGVASHAGLHPKEGISAGAIFADALSRLVEAGWHGEVVKGRERGTSNIGTVEGGEATNIVMPELRAEGEVRSYSKRFLDKMLVTFRREFERAAKNATKRAKAPKGRRGRMAKVRFTVEPIYHTFELGPSEPAVQMALAALRAAGVKAKLLKKFGGADANWLTAFGCPTATFGTGAHGVHQVGETLDLKEYLTACEVAFRLATT